MKFSLPKIKIFQLLLSLKYLYGLVIVLVIATFAILGFFLYKNFYQTITQSEEIILLRQEVAPDTIDMELVNRVLKLMANKIASSDEIDWGKIKNPFNPLPNQSVQPPATPPAENPTPEDMPL